MSIPVYTPHGVYPHLPSGWYQIIVHFCGATSESYYDSVNHSVHRHYENRVTMNLGSY